MSFFFEFCWGHTNKPIQRWYICACFQTSRKAFCKLNFGSHMTNFNQIFKFQTFRIFQILSLFSNELSVWTLLRLPQLHSSKKYNWSRFQTSREKFPKLQKAIWLSVINEIFKFPPQLDSFYQGTVCVNHFEATSIIQF